jgi:hypothetical protein
MAPLREEGAAVPSDADIFASMVSLVGQNPLSAGVSTPTEPSTPPMDSRSVDPTPSPNQWTAVEVANMKLRQQVAVLSGRLEESRRCWLLVTQPPVPCENISFPTKWRFPSGKWNRFGRPPTRMSQDEDDHLWPQEFCISTPALSPSSSASSVMSNLRTGSNTIPSEPANWLEEFNWPPPPIVEERGAQTNMSVQERGAQTNMSVQSERQLVKNITLQNAGHGWRKKIQDGRWNRTVIQTDPARP